MGGDSSLQSLLAAGAPPPPPGWLEIPSRRAGIGRRGRRDWRVPVGGGERLLMTKQPRPSGEHAGTKNPLQGGVKDEMWPRA